MTAVRDVITTFGLPMALYTDRAHWTFHTPQANGPVTRRQLTQVGRALDGSALSTSRRIRPRRAAAVSG